MKITSREQVTPMVVHEAVTVFQLLKRWSLVEETRGGYLEFIDEFEIEPGHQAEAHYHDTHEWYFILEGRGIVQIEDEARKVKPGDLIYIPRNARHRIYPSGKEKIRSLCFAVSYQPVGGEFYVPVDLPAVPVSESDSSEKDVVE